MSTCINRETGVLLHEYELGLLDNNDLDRFQQHLLECSFCFEQADQLRAPMQAFRNNTAERNQILQTAVHADEQSIWSRFLESIWPSSHFLLKPAVSLAMVLLLLPLAYRGLNQTEPSAQSQSGSVLPATMLRLATTRGDSNRPQHVRVSKSDLVIEFEFLSGSPNRPCRVILTNPAGEIIYVNDSLYLDTRLTSRLVVPWDSQIPGKYRLIINDPSDESALGIDTLVFEITD